MEHDIRETIKERLDIVEIVKETVPLRQAGANFKGQCPFHQEKSPSFMVSPAKQIWHCFGCSQGGDVFGFVMRRDGLEFPEALRILAERAGVEVEKVNPRFASQKNTMLDIVEQTTDFFHQTFLKNSAAAIARDYAVQRGITSDTIEEFRIGYSLPDFEALHRHLLGKGFGANDLALAGVSIKKKDRFGYFDRFRGRLMFPISNLHGQVVGFGGRILEHNDDAAKYMNSPQTSLYDKSRIVFGLDKAKNEIRLKGSVVLVEGYMDFLASYQAGIKNVVASSGTALTAEQVRLLKRFTDTAIFSFDSDSAGIQATERGVTTALREGLQVKVLRLPRSIDGAPLFKDPDECIRKDVTAWVAAIEGAQPFFAYFADILFPAVFSADPAEKKKAARKFLEVLALLPDPLEHDHWITQCATRLGFSESILWEEFSRIRSKEKPPTPSLVAPPALPVSNKPVAVDNYGERHLVALLIAYPGVMEGMQGMPAGIFTKDSLWQLYSTLEKTYTTIDMSQGDDVLRVIPMELHDIVHLLRLFFSKEYGEIDESEARTTAHALARHLMNTYIRSRRSFLQQKMREAESKGDSAGVVSFTQEFLELNNLSLP